METTSTEEQTEDASTYKANFGTENRIYPKATTANDTENLPSEVDNCLSSASYSSVFSDQDQKLPSGTLSGGRGETSPVLVSKKEHSIRRIKN